MKERIFECSKCGWIGDRDLNAALNLEKIGRATPEFTPGDCWSRLPWWKQEVKPLKPNR
ncbi:zinc ribbon domain-containing protein [Scytonema sp. PCC 10023]|uniref:zinc ribbon domain-containing protein n=1 Tax=Scytonema sp. PCC 10023 TaxID=1680591 RepID=UPI0039C64F6E